MRLFKDRELCGSINVCDDDNTNGIYEKYDILKYRGMVQVVKLR